MGITRPRLVGALWRRASLLDRIATSIVVLYIVTRMAKALGWRPAPGLVATGVGLISFLFFVAILFLLFRSRRWIIGRLLWRLRNRLILAYIFIAVVPVVLLLAMGGILGYLANMEVAAHLLHDDVHTRMQEVSAASREALALARATAGPHATLEALDRSPAIQALLQSEQQRLPDLTVEFSAASPTAQIPSSPTGPAQFVERRDKLWIEAASVGQLPDSRWIEARTRVPVTSRFLDELSPELGPLNLGLGSVESFQVRRKEAPERATAAVSTRKRVLPPPKNWHDFLIGGVTPFDALRYPGHGAKPVSVQLLAGFQARSSSLAMRIEGSLGEFQLIYVAALAIVAGLFIVLWLLAFIAGLVTTRTITRAVAKLDEATHHVKAGDFSHRISIEHRDQLGALAESFNSMTASIEELLEEQRQRQRLENELSIAREVQTELFPRSLPAMPGLELGAVCHAARGVSGDYYDCIQLDPNRVAMALADISGKGISAALLMASLNAALRSLVVSDGMHGLDTAALAQRLNRHLLLNTSDDRYATFFFAIYDSTTRRLDYTNAGHLPPFFITDDRVEKLDRGGTVIGLLDGCSYEQASIEIAPGSLLVAYSDGMTEPENAYGEEFGPDRLVEEILRHRHQRPERLCNELIETVRIWCAPEEPFDDQTVLIARME
jgi:sigma-B regulation protein RsbU (phosphoserine phosphatase)